MLIEDVPEFPIAAGPRSEPSLLGVTQRFQMDVIYTCLGERSANSGFREAFSSRKRQFSDVDNLLNSIRAQSSNE